MWLDPEVSGGAGPRPAAMLEPRSRVSPSTVMSERKPWRQPPRCHVWMPVSGSPSSVMFGRKPWRQPPRCHIWTLVSVSPRRVMFERKRIASAPQNVITGSFAMRQRPDVRPKAVNMGGFFENEEEWRGARGIGRPAFRRSAGGNAPRPPTPTPVFDFTVIIRTSASKSKGSRRRRRRLARLGRGNCRTRRRGARTAGETSRARPGGWSGNSPPGGLPRGVLPREIDCVRCRWRYAVSYFRVSYVAGELSLDQRSAPVTTAG